MKRILLQSFFYLAISSQLFSQSNFYKSFDIRGFENIIRTHDNGFACVTTNGLLKLDSETGLQYYKTSSSAASADFKLLTQTADSGYIIGTRINYQDPTELTTIAKFDKNGNYFWSKKYTFPSNTSIQTHDITKAHDNGFYILASGCVGSPIIIRCNENGDIIWQKSSNFPYANKILNFSESAMIIAGVNIENDQNHKLWVSKIDTSGNIQWSKSYDNNRVNFVQNIQKNGSNEFSVLITSQDNTSFISNATSTLIHLNSEGVILSASAISSGEHTGYHYMHGLAGTADQGRIFTGTINLMSPGTKIVFAKTDNNNNIQWARYFGNITLNNAGTNEGIQVFESENSFYIFSRNEDGLAIGKIDGNGTGFCDYEAITMHSNRTEFVTSVITLDIYNSNFSCEQTLMNFSEEIPELTIHCADVSNVSDNLQDEEIHCYPNPTSGQITIEANHIQQVLIYDMTGSLKKNLTNIETSVLNVNISDLPKGSYVFRIVTIDGISVRKIIHM
jgi:hypothetical protein